MKSDLKCRNALWDQKGISLICLFAISSLNSPMYLKNIFIYFYLFVGISHKNYWHKLYDPPTISEHPDFFPLTITIVYLVRMQAVWCSGYELGVWNQLALGLNSCFSFFPAG